MLTHPLPEYACVTALESASKSDAGNPGTFSDRYGDTVLTERDRLGTSND